MDFLQKLTPAQISALTPEMMEYLQEKENAKGNKLHEAIEYVESQLNSLYFNSSDKKNVTAWKNTKNFDFGVNEHIKFSESMQQSMKCLAEHGYVYVTYIPIEQNSCQHDHKFYKCKYFKLNTATDIYNLLGDHTEDINKYIQQPFVYMEPVDKIKTWLEKHSFKHLLLPYKIYFHNVRESDAGKLSGHIDLTQLKFINMMKLKSHITEKKN